MKNRQIAKALCTLLLVTFTSMSDVHGQGYERPAMSGDLRNKPEREEVFKDWALGMFVHWSFDSQLGSVISHSMDYASRDYLDRYVNELPKTFNPTEFDPDKWMEIAKLAGAKYMVFTTKHHNGFCMWDTKTTDFNIMNTPYGKDIVRQYVDACRSHGMKVGFYYSPEDFAFNYERDVPARGGADGRKYYDELVAYTKKHLKELFTNYGDIDVLFLDGGHKAELALWMFVNDQAIYDIDPCVTAGTKDVCYTQSKDGKYVYAFLTQFTDNDPKGGSQWGRSVRKEVVLKELKGTAETKVTVLGQEDRVEKFSPRHDIGTRFTQTDDGLEVSVKRAQRLYNNRRWPNAVVLRLENVEFK